MKKKLLLLTCLVLAIVSMLAVVGCKKTDPDYNGGEMIDGQMYKYGYTFAGWGDKDGTVRNNVTKPNGKYYKAMWSPKKFDIEITGVGEFKGYSTHREVYYGEDYDFSGILPQGYACDGVKIEGKIYPLSGVWEYDLSDKAINTPSDKDDRYFTYVLDADMYNVTVIECKITYHLNGGEFTSENPVDTYTCVYNQEDPYWMQFINVYKKGYYLKYWSYDEAGNDKFSRNSNPSKYEKNIDLYAIYEKGEYKVSVGNEDDQYTDYTLSYGEDYSFPVLQKDRYGNDFVGYYVRSHEYAGKRFGDEIIPAEGKFYVECFNGTSIRPYFGYRFIYNLDGGTNDVDNPVGHYGMFTNEATLKPATKENMTFEGWYSDAAFTKAVTKITTKDIENGDFNLYAKFSGKKVTATLDFDGGKCEALEKKTVTYHYNAPGSSVKTQTVEVKTGNALRFFYPSVEKGNDYAFKGWYKDKACTIPYNYDEPITASFDLYAGFVKLPSFNNSLQSYGTKYTINPYDYSVVDGKILSQRSIANSLAGHPTCLCFTAEYDGDYKICYRGDGTTASARLNIINVTQDKRSYDVKHTYAQFDTTEHSVTIDAKKGDFIVIEFERKLTTDREGDTAKFNFWFEGNFTKPESTAVATEKGAAVILEYGKPVNIPSPVKEGYAFVGWQKADGTMLDPEADWDILEDTTLKAIYKPNDEASE